MLQAAAGVVGFVDQTVIAATYARTDSPGDPEQIQRLPADLGIQTGVGRPRRY